MASVIIPLVIMLLFSTFHNLVYYRRYNCSVDCNYINEFLLILITLCWVFGSLLLHSYISSQTGVLLIIIVDFIVFISVICFCFKPFCAGGTDI